MALDPVLLEESILDVMEEVIPVLLPDEIQDVEVTEEQQPDGSTSYNSTTTTGPAQFGEDGRKSTRPLARAIAQAVIDHFIAHASVDLSSGRIS